MTTPPILSVSQVELYDPEQRGGCPRRWWFERVRGFRQDDTAASEDGNAGHALFKLHLTGGVLPKRARMLKAVQGALYGLPTPGPHLQVEYRFSGQPQYDATGARVPLDVSRTLWHAGHPWEGYIDLRFRHRDGTVTVWDHKFSSDIHERALPAERLIRTVQMPIYALDTLRQWPDAVAVNLVHLYVSRRGVESFIRHQRVSAEQVRERADELVPLVREMDAVRAADTQDDVPFNRAACHAYAGCPHQFRCNAFRRRAMEIEMTEEEQRMFGILKDEKPQETVKAAAGEPAWKEREVPMTQSSGGDLNLDDIFDGPLPQPSEPKPQPPRTCEACSEVLTPENSSRLKTGDVKHIGCPADARTPDPAKLSPRAEAELAGPRCESCPHPAHHGQPCTGKRGRGQCKCGVAAEQPQRPPAPVPVKVEMSVEELEAQAREAERAADLDGDGAAVEEARQLREMAERAKLEEQADRDDATMRFSGGGNVDESTTPEEREEYSAAMDAARLERELTEARAQARSLEEQLRTAREIIDDPELGPRGSWSGTLAVNVTVELGPTTLTFIQSLLKR